MTEAQDRVKRENAAWLNFKFGASLLGGLLLLVLCGLVAVVGVVAGR